MSVDIHIISVYDAYIVRCSLSQAVLSKELDFLRTGLPPEHVLPTPVRLSVAGDQLILSGGNSELSLSSFISITHPATGSSATRASLFRQLVSQLPRETVTLSIDSTRLLVEWPGGRASLPEQMLPVFNSDLGGNQSMVSAPAKVLGELLATSKPGWSETDARIPGVLLELQPGAIRLVAVDGYSMAIVGRSAECTDTCTVLLPSNGLAAIAHMLSDAKKEDTAILTIGEKCIRLGTGSRSIVVRAATGKFPDYTRIVPPVHDTPLLLHRSDLIEAVRRVVLTGDDVFSQVSFICRRDSVTLESEASREEFTASYAGPDTAIRFSALRLNKILAAIQTERVELYIGAERLPAMFKPQGDPSTTFILVPIRK